MKQMDCGGVQAKMIQGQRVETKVLTPMMVFNLPQPWLVPLFQRRYVWDRENQWELLGRYPPPDRALSR